MTTRSSFQYPATLSYSTNPNNLQVLLNAAEPETQCSINPTLPGVQSLRCAIRRAVVHLKIRKVLPPPLDIDTVLGGHHRDGCSSVHKSTRRAD